MMEDWRALITEQKSILAMSESERVEDEQARVIILLDGELVVEYQKCGTCRPKTVILTKAGSHKYIAPHTTFRLKNRLMSRAVYMEITTNSE
jgi:hypothetical protein